jgi:uncharacterized protein (DUF305 family)
LTFQLLEAAAFEIEPAAMKRVRAIDQRTITMKTLLVSAAILFGATTAAFAQETSPGCPTGHAGHQMGAMTDMSGMNDMQKAYAEGMDRMHPAMMAGVMAADPDVAFVCGMIPHHQGAIDMAKVVLQYGKDPWVRELAQKIIDAQTGEIADMNKWLADHAK